MTDPQMPELDITALGESAIAMFELFKEMQSAGFTETQALRLCAYMVMSRGEQGEQS